MVSSIPVGQMNTDKCRPLRHSGQQLSGINAVMAEVWLSSRRLIENFSVRIADTIYFTYLWVRRGTAGVIAEVHRRFRDDIDDKQANNGKGVQVIVSRDFSDLKGRLQNGDIIFTIGGPSLQSSVDWTIFSTQWLVKPFITATERVANSFFCCHTATYVEDDNGEGWIVEATPSEHGDHLRRIRPTHSGFALSQGEDYYYKVVRLADQNLAERSAAIAKKFSVPTEEELPTASMLRYGYLKALKSLIFPAEFSELAMEKMLISAVLADLPPPNPNEVYHGYFFCSMFTAWTLVVAQGKELLQKLNARNPNDSLLQVPQFNRRDPGQALTNWARLVVLKYKDQIKADSPFQFDHDYLTPQNFLGLVHDRPDLFQRVATLLPEQHPAMVP